MLDVSDRGADEGGGEENFQLVTVTNHKPEGQPQLATVSLSFHLILNEWIIQNDMKNILQAVQSQISVGGILVKPQDSEAAILKLEADVDASIETLPAVQRELRPNSSTSDPPYICTSLTGLCSPALALAHTGAELSTCRPTRWIIQTGV